MEFEDGRSVDIRGVIASASLKLGAIGPLRRSALIYPRRYRLGLIEALLLCSDAGLQPEYIRGVIASASLKRADPGSGDTGL